MVRLIWAKIDSVSGSRAKCHAVSNDNIKFEAYLGVLDRQGQADTQAGTLILALLDDVTGIAVCVYNTEGFAFKFSQDLSITGDVTASGDVTVTGDIKCNDCGVQAGTLSLLTHIHPVTGANTGAPTAPPTV